MLVVLRNIKNVSQDLQMVAEGASNSGKHSTQTVIQLITMGMVGDRRHFLKYEKKQPRE